MFVSLLASYMSLPLDNKLSKIVAISALLTIVSLYPLSRRLSTNVYLRHVITTIWEMQKKKNHIKRAILIALGLWKYDWFFSIYKKNYNGKWSYKLNSQLNKNKNILYLLNKHNFIEVKSGIDTCNYSILRNQVFIFLYLVCPNRCIIFHIAISIDKMLYFIFSASCYVTCIFAGHYVARVIFSSCIMFS